MSPITREFSFDEGMMTFWNLELIKMMIKIQNKIRRQNMTDERANIEFLTSDSKVLISITKEMTRSKKFSIMYLKTIV